VTGDDPFQRDLAHGAWSARDVHTPGDAEQTMRRIFELPAARSFSATAWVEPFSQTPDNVLDRLAGYRGPVVATSSSRFDGEPQYRASKALDGDPSTAWIGDWGHGAAWLQVRTRGPLRISALRLDPPALPVRRPTRVVVSWPGGASGPVPVSGGVVTLPHPVITDLVRITVVSAAAPAGASPAEQHAVGIASIGGLPRVVAPRRSVFTGGCGSAAFAVGATVFRLRVSGSMNAFEDGTPMMARSCGPAVPLAAGTQRLSVTYGSYAIDDLRLYSPAPDPVAVAASGGGVVVDSGTVGHGSYDGVRVSVASPSWLVLGESYDRGWQATCNGRSLGAPTPIDGYANGWPVSPGCRDVSFTFGPNKLALVGYVLSGVGGVVCLLLIGWALWRRRRAAAAPTPRAPLPSEAAAPATPPPATPLPPARALVWALPAAIVFGFVFGYGPGIVSLPVIAFVLWRGIGARRLTLAAFALLAVVTPVVYLVHTGRARGGNQYGYAMAHLGAHYVGVAAIGLLLAALWRSWQPHSESDAHSQS
jgi:arabinofuranan 3-O-arabinosyltransferase